MSKIINTLEADTVQQWKPPNVEQPGRAARGVDVRIGDTSPVTAEQLESLQKQAYEEGYQQGKAEGFEYGHKEALAEGRTRMQSTLTHLEKLVQSFQEPLANLDAEVENSLIELVISMVRQLVRREVKTDPGQIIGVMREALAILPVSSRDIRVVLHPDDAEFVRNVYEMNENDLGWEIVEDPVLARGGCRVLSGPSQVDATLESRLANLIAPLIGDERDTTAEPNTESEN